jgi:hypothetical protein
MKWKIFAALSLMALALIALSYMEADIPKQAVEPEEISNPHSTSPSTGFEPSRYRVLIFETDIADIPEPVLVQQEQAPEQNQRTQPDDNKIEEEEMYGRGYYRWWGLIIGGIILFFIIIFAAWGGWGAGGGEPRPPGDRL